MDLINMGQVEEIVKGKRIAVVGSAPTVLKNAPGFIDSHDLVVRVNNYKLSDPAGTRTDIFYSFFGGSVRKHRDQLIKDGVKYCLCKCPNQKAMDSSWHDKNNKGFGTDFRYIYRSREKFWFCPTYVPSLEVFMDQFRQLDNHIPSTGMACIMLLSGMDCEIFLTGFDFFASKKHNVDEPWRHKNPDDPIGHSPANEIAWLTARKDWFIFDDYLRSVIA